MARSIGGLNIRNARSVDHVELSFNQMPDQHRRTLGVVRVIAIDHDINVGLDVGKHAAHDVAFALQRLIANDGTCDICHT